MYFPFNCLGCGHENHADWSQIGRQVYCRACLRAAIVPAPMEPVEGDSKSGLAVRFACPVCGRSFATKPALVGQKIRCSGCGAGVRVPAANSFPVEYASRVVLSALSGSSRSSAPATGPASLVRPPAGHSIPVANEWRVPLNGTNGSSRSMARAAGATVRAVEAKTESDPPSSREQLEAIGGLSRREHAAVVLPSRGETMEQVRQEVAKQEAAETTSNAEKAKKAKKKKRKKTGFFDLKETLTLVAGVSVVVGVLAFLAWYFPEFQYPLGGLLAVIGFVLYLLGAMSLRRIAENEGFVKSMAYRFFPPYQLWFVVTRWADTRDYFAFFISGLIIAVIGVAMIITSPSFKKAEESDRAYQAEVDEFVRGKGPQRPPPAIKRTDNPNN